MYGIYKAKSYWTVLFSGPLDSYLEKNHNVVISIYLLLHHFLKLHFDFYRKRLIQGRQRARNMSTVVGANRLQ